MRPVALLAVALAFAGCARIPVVTDGLAPDARAARLRAIDDWDMRGRIAVDTGERAFQARFRWFQRDDSLRLVVLGPAFSGNFQISGTAEQLTVLSRGEERILNDPEIELSEMFGWWLPVTSLESWLLGLPDERYPSGIEVTADGSPTAFEQRLWRVRYSEYQLAAGLLIPRRVTLAHAPVALDLTIDSFEPADTAATLN